MTALVLIITGTIIVNSNVPTVSVTDENKRLCAYLDTILWAINDTFFSDIIFCENTNYNSEKITAFEKYAKKHGKNFVYLTFNGSTENIITYGKGYGEGEIIEYCMDHVRDIQFLDDDYFCKITGRLIIPNINDLLPKKKLKYPLYAMRKDGLNQIDTRFYCVNNMVYRRYFRDCYHDVNDRNGEFLEHIFYDTVSNFRIKYHMFKCRPFFKGVAGSTGRIYNDTSNKIEAFLSFLCFTNLYNTPLIGRIIKKMI